MEKEREYTRVCICTLVCTYMKRIHVLIRREWNRIIENIKKIKRKIKLV